MQKAIRHTKHQIKLILLLIFLSTEAWTSEEKIEPQATAVFVKVAKESSEFPVSVPTNYASLRGYLVLKEMKSNGLFETNRLPVVVVKARKRTIKPPVLKLSGGPGLSGIGDAAYPNAYPWLAERDLIIMGQRGTKHAEPALLCPEYREALNDTSLTDNSIIDAALTCKSRYVDAQIDLNGYHSFASAKDIEALRVSLGIDVFSIFAGSYGTRLALTYARDFPDRVSSMVLDSPLPHNAIYDDESPSNFRNTLIKIADACSKQVSCSEAFPNLYARFSKTLEEVAQMPWSLNLPNGEHQILRDSDLALLLDVGSLDGIKQVPIKMDSIARKDSRIIAALLSNKVRTTDFAWGMRLSVWCSESIPFSQRSHGKDMHSFASLDGAVVTPEVCSAWGVEKRPESEKLPTVSSVPTLIIAGDFDALTPPEWGERAANTLINSYVASIPFGRHMETMNWSGDGCAMKIANTFFTDEALFLTNPIPATECLSKRQSPKFSLRFTNKENTQ